MPQLKGFFSGVRPGAVRILCQLNFSLLLIAAVNIFSGCRREVAVPFRVEVRTNQGDPVHEAEVKLSGRSVGFTDAKGELAIKPALVDGSKVALEISKSSDSYYFAPHTESIDLGKSKERPVSVKAVLYFVPKPKPVQAASLEPAGNTAVPEQVAPAAAVPEVAAADTAQEAAPAAASVAVPEVVKSADPAETGDSGVPQNQAATSLARLAEQETKPVEVKKVLVTVHVFSGKTQVSGADVKFIGPSGEDEDSPQCKTNVRGRCALRLDEGSSWSLNVSRTGYFPEASELMVTEANKVVRVQLAKGQTLEVAAFGRGVTTTRPLSGVQVLVDGEPAGTTDDGGRLVHKFKGAAKDKNGPVKMKVELVPPGGFTPESATINFPANGPAKIVRHFVGSLSKIPVTMIDDPMITTSTIEPDLINRVRRAVDSAIDRKVFAKRIFARATRLHKNPDFRVRRVITEGPESLQVELLIVDVKGIVVAAAKEMLPREIDDDDDLKGTIDGLVVRMVRSVPFHGVVVESSDLPSVGSAKNRQIRAELPGQLASLLEPGDRFDVFGNVVDERQRLARIANIATGVVPGAPDDAGVKSARGTGGSLVTLNLEGGDKNQVIQQGDVLVLRPVGADPSDRVARIATRAEDRSKKKSPAVKYQGKNKKKQVLPAADVPSIMVRARTQDDPRGLANANVYFDDVWIGTTNSNGVLYLSDRFVGKKGALTASKAGWTTVVVKAEVPAKGQLEVALEAEPSRLRVDSLPTGVGVYLDGKLAGKTPLDTPMDGSGSFVKLELEGPEGYKRKTMILEIESGTLDFTGPRSVELEEDIVGRARGMADAGKAGEAIDALNRVSESHSDYLLSRHMAGELALSKLNDPEKAAAYFAEVTANPEVRDFIDKRFVGSHINEGIALHMLAEKESSKNADEAAANFNRAAKILDKASRYTRFLPKKDFEESVRNLEYFRALSYHRQWLLTKDDAALSSANRAWRDYLDDAMAGKTPNKQTKVLADNAKVYLKQTQAGMAQR